VAALWELGRRGGAAAEGLEAICGCLSHALADIRAEAARTLAALGPAGRSDAPALLEVLDDSDAEVRAAAAFALGKLGVQSAEGVDVPAALAERLEDADTEAACAAAWAMAQFGRAAEASLPAVLDALRHAIWVSGYAEIDYCAYAVRAIAPEPQAALGQVVESCDAEVRPQAAALLAQRKTIGAADVAPGSWFGR
jgi:HEAT repeat protein